MPAVPLASLIDLDSTFLPVAQMRQISRVTELSECAIVGELDLGMSHWVFGQHFPGDPIFPGTLMLEAAGQLVALWAWGNGQRGRPRLVRIGAEFRSPVSPADASLTLRAVVKRRRNLYFGDVVLRAGDRSVATVSAVLAVLALERNKDRIPRD
jgi:3-hydroxymyristoyl/3-hydroxydecanoyl-(acyl carrier protein) dehydratase